MIRKLSRLLEIYEAEISNNTEVKIEHFTSLTNSLFTLINSLYENKEEISHFHSEIEGKFFRFGLANQSLVTLIKGNSFNLLEKDVVVADMFSIYSIVRMQIEAYLIMFYLFFDDVNDDEKNLRYDVYRLHGLQKQASFKLHNETPKDKVQLEKIRKETLDAIQLIKNSPLYKNASEKEKKEFLKPRFAKLVKSEILFEKSGITQSRIDQMWSIFSNHAHSEYISDRQFNTAYKINNSIQGNTDLAISLCTIMTSKLLVFLTKTFKSAQEKMETLEVSEQVDINFWSTFDKRK